MNRHQVLTGAANSGDHCFASGSVEGVHFTAYATGCDIAILASDFQRVQIIPGAVHGKIQVACIDCCSDSGKIAASYGEKVCVFEPTPLLNPQSTHKLDYQWYHTGTITAECQVKALSWNQEGSRLLTGGDVMQMWQCPDQPAADGIAEEENGADGVAFYIDDAGHEEMLEWQCIWHCRPATPVYHLKFSPDGLLFTSVGKDDRLAKIWYENKKVQFTLMRTDSISPKKEEVNFAFVYIAHPKAVTGISWRKTSKYMPRGSVANMLITSCRDNICRIWVETILPEDGLVDMQQLDPQAINNPMFHTHRHKNRLMQRLHHIRNVANRRKRTGTAGLHQGISPLPSSMSEHDFHKFGVHPNSVAPGFHFHLAASINPETDIPLLPVVNSQHPERDSGFVVHWLNNKELHFTLEAERILTEMSKGSTSAAREDDEESDDVDGESLMEEHKPPETPDPGPTAVPPASSKRNRKFLHRHKQMSTESDASMGSMASVHSGISHSTHTSAHTEPPKPDIKDDKDNKEKVTPKEEVTTRKHKKFKLKHKRLRECPTSPRDFVKALRSCISAPNLEKMEGQEDVSMDVELVDESPWNSNKTNTMYASMSSLNIKRDNLSHLSFDMRGTGIQRNGSGFSLGHTMKNVSFADLTAKFPRVISYTTLCHMHDGHFDALDYRIETLLRDWHQSVDMLFSIHPVDGSFLVWLVDWLDEYSPGSFRQAQVSFSSRIPHALPVFDAMTMSTNLLLYCNHSKLDIKATLRESASKQTHAEKQVPPCYQSNATGHNSPGQSDNNMAPNVLMLSKHSNGTLNLWQITFAESSHFSTILSVAHASRASGHRFHANSAACHPVLPLLLTTSHHNSPAEDSNSTKSSELNKDNSLVGFCSELILWRVDPVGPLSQSGGITELARINSPEVSAFSNVSWLPTLLPSSTLGPISNSPSALFVSSDGSSLQIYMAVIDARTLLNDLRAKPKSEALDISRSNSSTSSGYVMNSPIQDGVTREAYNIVSMQSTARPGCVIELQTITDAKQDWKHIQLMHVFQEQLVTGSKSTQYDKKGHTHLEPIVDLQNITEFEEHFYLVVVEKIHNGTSVLHMWRIVIASMEEKVEESGKTTVYSPDTRFYQHDWEHGGTPPTNFEENMKIATPRITITSSKVCTQVLQLPDSIKVTHVTMSAGHLSSSTIYPACFAPYLLSTACTDGQVRFWKCQTADINGDQELPKFEWVEWEMMIPSEDSSAIHISGKPLSVSCGYSGRVAVAYRIGHVRTQNDNPDSKFVNLYVSIYECESTGGSEWTLEDTIQLKNISIPETKSNIDLSVIYNNEAHSEEEGDSYVLISPTMATPAVVRNVPIPSNATIQSVKKSLNTQVDHSNILKQKHLVLLDWVSTEDGSHILTVGVGNKILLFAPVSSEIAQASQKDIKDAKKVPLRRQLQKTKSMTVMSFVEEIRWMKIRSIELSTADCLPPLPMHMSWVRDGILVVGMDNEMHVYSQWRGPGEGIDSIPVEGSVAENRTLTEQSLRSVASTASLGVPKAFKNSFSSTSITALASSLSTASLDKDKKGQNKDKEIKKSESVNSMQLIQDCGLFEAARLANPVLPQYHPKQLIELLNFGKVRRVKAILAHLVRCIAGNEYGLSGGMAADDVSARHRLFSSPRPLSVHASAAMPDGKLHTEDASDNLEIASIPPLPLYALLAADSEKTYNVDPSTGTTMPGGSTSKDNDYSTLFNPDFEDDLEDPFDDSEIFATSPSGRDRRRSSMSSGPQNPNYFGPQQSRLLARHLTRTQLPGLASLDQMYLLALADTVANTRLEFGEKETPDVAVSKVVARESGQPEINTEGLDDCGLRFMLAARHHVYLMNTLPIIQRVKLQKTGLSPAILVWAFHSEAEEDLLNVIPSVQKGEPVWNELRVFGVGWWVRNITTLRRIIEKTAKAAFQVKKDPMDAALFYIAMKKKTLVWGLFRSVSDQKMMDFFKNDFSQDRWRRAALKNAFALMARQRFQHAAAFFLLAGAVRDAIEVCLNKLDDFQLAVIIARLYESEFDDSMPSSLKQMICEECLGGEPDSTDITVMHPDPFIRSMAYWMLKDYSAALGTLLETQAGTNYKDKDKEEEDQPYAFTPSVFNFYNYLRTHPLLVRQQLAMSAADKNQTVLLSGFSRGKANNSEDKNVTYVDRITPVERRLYFTTAHMHFKSGCPMLALEVLSTLPAVVDTESDITKSRSADSMHKQASITTGTLEDAKARTASDFDWSQPVSNKIQTADSFDWSTPVQPSSKQTVDSFDWGTPVSKFIDEGLDLSLDKEGVQDDGDTKSDSEIECKDKLNFGASTEVDNKDSKGSEGLGDIMAHQLKFIACLKIMMEELSTLATGFEVDGGQLRYQLYIWLERQVDCLKQQCAYGIDVDNFHSATSKELDESKDPSADTAVALSATDMGSKATLHEIILAEKLDFDAKQVRMARRKQWLKANQQLLRTLLSYSVLHGSCGGGLASVRMELILLLQELQQEKTQQQLLSPLPFPTSLPLLSASVASAKTVIADPIRHLQNMAQDMLHALIMFAAPPTLNNQLNKVFLLRNLSAALAACFYQCLCDSDSFVISLSDKIDVGMEGFANTSVVYKDSYLMAGAQHRSRCSTGGEQDTPNSQPAKWPGVSQLRALLAREKDEDLPKLNILLCETLVAVYMSLLVHALAMYDANILYRLVAHPFNEKMWPALFGGGVKKIVEVTTSSVAQQRHVMGQDEMTKQRMKLHMKVMGGGGTSPHLIDDKPTYKEKFVPPEVSMISYFMTKPYENPNEERIDYDSAESAPSTDGEEEDLDYLPVKRSDTAMSEHLDPNSYSWCLLRYVIVKYIRQSLITFLPKIGIEIPELPVCSPLMQSVLKTMEKWEEILQTQLEMFSGPPDDYIPGCYVDTTITGPPIHKYKTMTEPTNTPFLSHHFSALPAKRLWHYLIKQESLQDTFIRYIFRKKKVSAEEDSHTRSGDHTDSSKRFSQPMKIIHKEQDIITSFCLNQYSTPWTSLSAQLGPQLEPASRANLNCMAVATQKEIVEMDVSGILNPPLWLEDETEYDIETIRCPSPNKVEAEEFLLIQTPQDKPGMVASPSMSSLNTPSAPGVIPAPSSQSYSHTSRGAGLDIKIKGLNIPGITHPSYTYYIADRSRRILRRLAKRQVGGVKRMGAHPHLPYYLTGSQDGSVRLWEWGHNQGIAVARQPGTFPKVTKVLFNSQGNKFGVSDVEGSLCLWQVGLGVNMNKPFLNLKCHNKTTSDFVFVGSSSLLATGGYSSNGRNVCLWDTLLPKSSSLVQGFSCHNDGGSAVLYSPKHQVLISSGKMGDICLFDMRHRHLRHTFQAHDSSIRCMALDPAEEFFVTGSADGDIKVWNLGVHNLAYSFPGEHAKNSIFRNMGSGVTQIHMSINNHLFSCGADGSMKVRKLPDRHSIVNTWI